MAGVPAATKTTFKADVSALTNSTYGLSALKTLLDTISGHTDVLDDATNGLAAIRTLAAAIPTSNPSAASIATAVNSGTVGTNVSSIKTAVESATYGLSALKALIDAIPTSNPSVPTVAQIVSGVQAADFDSSSAQR